MNKLDHGGRSRLNQWLTKNAVRIAFSEINEKNHIGFYSVGGTLVAVIDMYSQEKGDYMGFELLTPSPGNKVSAALDELESILQD